MIREHLEQVFNKYIPESYWNFHGNYDDINEGFEINIDTGAVIRVLYPMQYENEKINNIVIEKFVLNLFIPSVLHKIIYCGKMPKTEDSKLDIDFIGKILRNWKNF